ncbi:MAG: glycosyltransferase family 4 protein [Sulfuritalea sp.]|nr:glycosyltransferase family 4 protein [Sulfuritalea sp.]
MKILLLLSAIPYEQGEAIEVVSLEVVRLMATAGHEVHVQVLIREGWSKSSAEREEHATDQFSPQPGVHLLPTIYLGELIRPRSRIGNLVAHLAAIVRSLPGLRRYINPYLFPAVAARPAVADQVKAIQPDVIASIWSWEALAASYDIPGVPKFVYYGNPNHKPPEAQFRYPALFDIETSGLIGRLKFGILKLLNRAREIQHLRMMAACEATANNALIDASYYTAMGHPRSIYLQNMWPDAAGGAVFGGRPAADGLTHICGSVGNVGATGNTFGLHFLGAELMPCLRTRLGDEAAVMDIFGGGKPRSLVASVLRDPSIRLRGWVGDLNAEIVRSAAFLVLTNAYGFNVGNTRILLAWSLGACVIAHTSSALSMPEMVHGENALLGETAEEIADLVVQAIRDPDLRARVGRGGYDTFLKYYRSETVVPRMLVEIDRTVQDFRQRYR